MASYTEYLLHHAVKSVQDLAKYRRNEDRLKAVKDAMWSTAVTALTVILLVPLVMKAGQRAEDLDAQTSGVAKYMMSIADPDSICVAGLGSGMAAHSKIVRFYCVDDNGKEWNRNKLWAPRDPNNNASALMQKHAVDVILALHCCGAVEYFYTVDGISKMVNSSDDTEDALLKSWKEEYARNADIDRKGACLKLLESKYCEEIYTNGSSVIRGRSPYFNEILCTGKRAEIGALNLTGVSPKGLTLTSEIFQQGHYSSVDHFLYVKGLARDINKVTRADQYQASSDSEFKRVHVFEGTWAMNAHDDNGMLWMKIRQTNNTAKCLGSTDLSEFWSRNTGCRENQPLWLTPGLFSPYFCLDGVNVDRFQQYSASFEGAIQEQSARAEPFLGIRVNGYNDLYAIYTAVLGALLGVAVLLIANICLLITRVVLWARLKSDCEMKPPCAAMGGCVTFKTARANV